MKQIKKRIKFQKKTWTVKNLFPVDFIELSYWPLSYYKLKDDPAYKRPHEIKRDWKLPPQNKIDETKSLEDALNNVIMKGAGVTEDECAEIRKNQDLHNFLFSEIYALTYNLTPIEKCFAPQKIMSKDFAELLAIKAKSMNVEPYSFMTDISKEEPEIYNPKRYDFNFFILGVGWDRERKETEKLHNKIKKGRK